MPSVIPTIPEFVNTPEEMSTALRAIKLTLEIISGLRQGEGKGAPQMYVQAVEPSRAASVTYKIGDLWVNTDSNRVYFWTGRQWQITG